MFLSVLILAGATVWIIYDNASAPYQKMEGKIFGTYYHITYQSSADYSAELLHQLNNVDNSLSTFNEQSIVSRINRNENPETDKMFIEVFELAQNISDITNGSFDITIAPLVNLWGFGFKNSSNTTQEKIDSLLPFVGYKTLSLRNKKLIKQHPETMLDFSAIAKGYGCDVVALCLEAHGVKNYMIEIGGEIRAKGLSPQKRQWVLGIAKPTDDSVNHSQQLQSTVSMPQTAIATSGNYRNFYYKDGQKYAHTINPKTGRPVIHNLLSATVFAQNCATADAFATAFMVMGVEKAKEILNNNKQISAYLIYSDKTGQYKIWYSESIGKYLDK